MIYRIKDWNTIYETAESRKLVRCRYVCTPNKHDGKGYRRMISKGPALAERLFAAWNAIIQVASKSVPRGTLADSDGALTADDLSQKTGLRKETFELAFEFFSSPEIGWLEKTENAAPPQKHQGHTPDVRDKVGSKQEITGGELTGVDLKGIEKISPPLPPAAEISAECWGILPTHRTREGVRIPLTRGERERRALEKAIAARPDYPWQAACRMEALRKSTAREVRTFLDNLPLAEDLAALQQVLVKSPQPVGGNILSEGDRKAWVEDMRKKHEALGLRFPVELLEVE